MLTSLPSCARTILAICLLPGLLAACSNIKTYPDRSEKNFVIHTRTDSGSVFTSVSAALDIYQVDAQCEGAYSGTVKLSRDNMQVGIAPGKMSYLSFRFDRGGFLSNSRGRTSYETLIKPRKGYLYDVRVRYVDDIYNVEILEKRSASDKGREVPVHYLDECKKLAAAERGSTHRA